MEALPRGLAGASFRRPPAITRRFFAMLALCSIEDALGRLASIGGWCISAARSTRGVLHASPGRLRRPSAPPRGGGGPRIVRGGSGGGGVPGRSLRAWGATGSGARPASDGVETCARRGADPASGGVEMCARIGAGPEAPSSPAALGIVGGEEPDEGPTHPPPPPTAAEAVDSASSRRRRRRLRRGAPQAPQDCHHVSGGYSVTNGWGRTWRQACPNVP